PGHHNLPTGRSRCGRTAAQGSSSRNARMDETLRDVQPRCCIDRLRAPANGRAHEVYVATLQRHVLRIVEQRCADLNGPQDPSASYFCAIESLAGSCTPNGMMPPT